MKKNMVFEILSCLPIILLALYFIPFLGICLILFRFFMYKNKRISTNIFIIVVGLLILIPKGLELIFDMLKLDINIIPYLSDILNNELYNINFIKYSKFLICVGVIFLIISFVVKSIFDKVSNKLSSGIKDYISDQQKREDEISRKNDLEMKIKQEKSRNTSYVKCPNCGSDNLVSDKFTNCKYCRRKIENKNYKG